MKGNFFLLFIFFNLLSHTEGSVAAKDIQGEVSDFSLTERSGRNVTRHDLQGKYWIASFIFTRCGGPCPLVSSAMARLQKDLAGQEKVRLVTFTVDPDHDTPEILKEYASGYGAEPERWLFLTGPREEMYALIRNNFLLGVEQAQGKDPQSGQEVSHSTRLVVVDDQGMIRGYYDGTDPESVTLLEKELSLILWKNRLPAVNAFLNGICAVLLLIGYLAIRKGRVRLHKICMLTALGVSALFLTSYLYFHLVVRKGQHTPFPVDGWVQEIYFAVLSSHTILAMVVAPLALFTTYQGLRMRLALHVRVARWTLPLWLYVSITGVIVYWMLYELYPSR